mmetsp:Transcript_14700/g.23010  ORF Transcript_14700/g.23010 Transcript_14700/m.23010 type:complete len:430 (-) Transcript_14700:18-1307(-)
MDDAPPLLDGLVFQPWQPLKCDTVEFEDEEDDLLNLDLLDMPGSNDANPIANDADKLFQIKCQFSDQCTAIVLTDLINVWYCEQSSSQISALHGKLNPAMASTTISQINEQLQNMLCFSDQKGSAHCKHMKFSDQSKQTALLTSSFRIENIIDFKWQFQFVKYGSSTDQATLLKQQLILPLMSIANELACKLNPQQMHIDYNRNASNTNSVFQQKITDTFLQFNIRGTMPDLYRNTMDLLTVSQCGGVPEVPQVALSRSVKTQEKKSIHSIDRNHSHRAHEEEPVAAIQRSVGDSVLPKLPKGRKKKRPLSESMEDGGVDGGPQIDRSSVKRRRLSEHDSDDDVLQGLMGREDDLKMSAVESKKHTASTMDTMQFVDDSGLSAVQRVTETQEEREELQRRQELEQKLAAKKNDTKAQKKKKKKKNKLRI